MERANYTEYLEWFHDNADFGPADGDVRDNMIKRFMKSTGKQMPEGWTYSDGETSCDEE